VTMLPQYIEAAMRRAEYEIIEDDGTFYGHIPETQGVWANADTLEECREELASVLEGWILVGLSRGLPIPVIENIDSNPASQRENVGGK
jgi:predicted RNase H-like HicB family nuclease